MTIANCVYSAPPPPIQTLNVVNVSDSFAALQWNVSSSSSSSSSSSGRRINTVDDRIGAAASAALPSTSTIATGGFTRRPTLHATVWRKSVPGRSGGEIGASQRPFSYSLSWNAQENFTLPPYGAASSSSNIILPSSQTEVMLGGLAPNTRYLLGLFAFNECARTQPLSIRFATRRAAVESDGLNPFMAGPSSHNYRLLPRPPNAPGQVPPPPFSPPPAILPHELILVMIVMILWIFILRRFFQTYKKITCVNVLPTAFGSTYELTRSGGGGNGATDDDHSRRRSNTSSALWDRKVSNVSAVEESRSSNVHNQFELLEGAVCAWRSETVLSTRLPRENYPSSSAACSDRDGSRPENVPKNKRSSISISGVPMTLERFLLEQRRRHRRHRRQRSGGTEDGSPSRSVTASRVGVDECCSSSTMMAGTADVDKGEDGEEDPVLVRFSSCSPTKTMRMSADSGGGRGDGEAGPMMLSSSPRASVTTLPCYPIPRVTIELDSSESSVARKISLNFTPTPSDCNRDHHLHYPYHSFARGLKNNMDSLFNRQQQKGTSPMHYSHSMPTFHRNPLKSGGSPGGGTTNGTATGTVKRKNALATVVMAATTAAAAAADNEQRKRRGSTEDTVNVEQQRQTTAGALSESTRRRSTAVRRTVPNPHWRMATASAVASTVTSASSRSASESASTMTAAAASRRRRSYYIIDAVDGSPIRRKISDVLLGKATKDIRRCSTFTGNNSVNTPTAGQLLRLQQHAAAAGGATTSPALQRKRQLSTHSSLRRRLSNFGSSLPRRFSLRRKSRRSAFVRMSSLQEERECSPLAATTVPPSQ